MEITRLAGLLPVLMLTACQGADQPGIVAQNGVPTKWTFNFFTPQALPALVTFAVVQDAGGKVYEFTTLDSTKALYGVIGGWDDLSRTLNGYWNHVERPPRHIIFCWDSVMDKKVYETHLTIPQPVLEKMLRPGVYKGDPGHTGYHNAVQIGLAPEGKVAVWLSGVSRGEPNYRVTPSVLYTLSGDKLSICKGITRFSTGYEFGENTKDFIKG
ncbi:DUF2931 family protein, partial [Erwinia amylovora]